MNDFREITFLQESLVKVTNLHTVIGTITYSMSEITSINLTKKAKSYRPLLMVPGGILLIGWGLIDVTGEFIAFLNIGILLSLVGIFLFMLSRPTYGIRIGSVSGEKTILRSTDRLFIQKVVDAMKSAIADMG